MIHLGALKCLGIKTNISWDEGKEAELLRAKFLLVTLQQQGILFYPHIAVNELSPMAGAGEAEPPGKSGALILLQCVGDGNVLPRNRIPAVAEY